MKENNETSTSTIQQENRIRKPIIPGMLRRRHKLPEDFHETLVGLENIFITNHTIESVKRLTELYKIGVEYYSTRDRLKQEFYLNRLNLFLNSKTVLRMLKKLKGNNKDIDVSNSNNTNCLEYDYHKTNILGLMQMNKISWENENSQIISKIKEMINKLEVGCLRAANMVRDSLREQSKVISKKLQIRRASKFRQSDVAKERTFIKRRTTMTKEVDFLQPGRSSTPYKTITKNLLDNHNQSSFNRNINSGGGVNAIFSKLKNKKEKNIRDTVDNFVKKFYHFFQNNLTDPTNEINMIYDNFYCGRIEKYKETIETFLEFEVMIFNNSNETLIRSVANMKNSLEKENERELIEAYHVVYYKILELITSYSQKDISEFEGVTEYSKEAIDNLVKIFK